MARRSPEPTRASVLSRPALVAIVAVGAGALVIALIVFLLTRGGDGAAAEDASITLTEILNQVETDVGDAQFAVASVGQVLATGDGVKTFPDSQARVDLAIRDFKRVVRTTPNTVWRLGQFGVDQDTVIEMDSGKVFMWDSGEAEGNPAVKVQTPAGVAAVRGTWMSVNYDAGAGLLELDCYRGSCELSNDEGSVILTDQQKSQTTASTTPTPAVPMEQDELDEWKQLPEVLRGTLIIPEVSGTATPSSSSDLPNFENAVSFNTIEDFTDVFDVLVYRYGPPTTGTNVSYRMERVGEETVGGVQTVHVKLTTNGDPTNRQIIDSWTDDEGTLRKMLLDGNEIPEEQLPIYVPLITEFFAPLEVVPDIETFDGSMFSEGGRYSMRTNRTANKTFGATTAKTYILQFTVAGQGTVNWEISDFGDVTLFTSVRFLDAAGMQTTVDVTEVYLREPARG